MKGSLKLWTISRTLAEISKICKPQQKYQKINYQHLFLKTVVANHWYGIFNYFFHLCRNANLYKDALCRDNRDFQKVVIVFFFSFSLELFLIEIHCLKHALYLVRFFEWLLEFFFSRMLDLVLKLCTSNLWSKVIQICLTKGPHSSPKAE